MKSVLCAAVVLLALGAGPAWSNDDQPISDAWITTKVKAALATESDTSAVDIGVTTKDGVVVLSGTTRSEAEADLAEREAKMIDGVKEVRNQIEVRKQ